jgi:hypothetical protein
VQRFFLFLPLPISSGDSSISFWPGVVSSPLCATMEFIVLQVDGSSMFLCLLGAVFFSATSLTYVSSAVRSILVFVKCEDALVSFPASTFCTPFSFALTFLVEVDDFSHSSILHPLV